MIVYAYQGCVYKVDETRPDFALPVGAVVIDPSRMPAARGQASEVIPGLGSLADLPGPARIEAGCRSCH